MTTQMLCYTIELGKTEVTIHSFRENDSARQYSWNSKRHCNAEYELHMILRGECSLDVEENHYQLRAGQAVVIAPGKYHRPHTELREFERFSLGFSLSEGPLLEELKRIVPQCLCFTLATDSIQYCNEMISEREYKNPFREQAQEALLTLLTISLLRNLQTASYQEPSASRQEEIERTSLIDNYFERYFAEKSGCAVLAQQLHLSTRQLDRILKDHYGMGFQEKLIHTRMDHAALLLRTTEQTVQDIIGAVGYNSVTAFYKAFRDAFSMTPQQYRQYCEKMTSSEK